ncbi:hypothetical protein ACTA71_011622 [Dictyostelium dimigraforme]
MATQNPRPILKGTKSNFTLVHNIGNVSDEKVKEYLKTEILVKEWIEEVLQIKIKESLSDALKNGIVLCYLANAIQDNIVPTITEKSRLGLEFKKNIDFFLLALKDLGFPKQKLFKLNDLYEGECIVRVVECLSQLSKFACQNKGFQIPIKLTPTSTQPIKLPTGEYLNHLKLQLSQIKEYTMDKSNSNQPRMGTAVLKAKMALLAGNSIDFAKCERGFIQFQSLWRGFRVRQFVKHMKREVAYREKVIQEILKTEEDYVKNLNICIKGYMEPLVSREVITKDQQKLIFSDIQIIYNFGNKFLDQLKNRCGNNWRVYQKISDLFLQISAFLKVYTSYVQNYNTALETLEELKKKDKQFIQVLNEQKESQQINGKDITSFLIQPVQRVPRYYLLLTDLVKHTWEDHPDLKPLVGAAEKIKDVAAFLNERKREGENFQKFTEIQSILVGKVPQLFTPSRRYIKQISFNPTKKHEIMVYLFNDLIVYGKVMKGIFSSSSSSSSGSNNNNNTTSNGNSQYSNYNNNNNNNNNIINENRKVKYQGMIELVACVVVDDNYPSPSSHLDIRSNDKDSLLLLTIISKNEIEKNNLKIEINKLISHIHENQRSKEQKIIENSNNNNNNIPVPDNTPEPTIEQQLSERKKTMKRVESNSINSTTTTTTTTTTASTTIITPTSTTTTPSTTPINSPSRSNSSNNIVSPTSSEHSAQQSIPVSSFISSLFNKKKSSSYNSSLSPNKVENYNNNSNNSSGTNTPTSDSESSGNTSPQSQSSSFVDESEKASPKSSRKKKAQSISMSSSPTNGSNTTSSSSSSSSSSPPPPTEDTNSNDSNTEIQEPPKEKGRPRSKSTSRLSRITGVLTLRKRKTQLVDESQIQTSDDESPTSPSKPSIDLSQSQQNAQPSSQQDDSSLASSISPLSISTPNPIPIPTTSSATTNTTTTSTSTSPNSATTHRLSSSSTILSTNNNECEPSNNKAGSSTSDLQSSSSSSSSSSPPTNCLSYEKIIAQKSLGDLDPLNLETYLSNAEFKKVFGVERSEFLKYPKWKQNQKKKELRLL